MTAQILQMERQLGHRQMMWWLLGTAHQEDGMSFQLLAMQGVWPKSFFTVLHTST
jgi:hypothetical protein